MAEIQTPSQEFYINPFDQNIYDWNNIIESNVYMSRVVNSLCKAYGDDFVISGMILKDLSFSDNIVSITVNPGMVIQDLTLVSTNISGTLTFDVSDCADTGYLLIHSHFQWLNTPEPNQFELRMSYYNPDLTGITIGDCIDNSSIANPENFILNNGWNHKIDRILLGIIKFEKNISNQVISVEVSEIKNICIYSKIYNVRNRSYAPLFLLLKAFGILLQDDGDVVEYSENEYDVKVINGNIYLDYEGVQFTSNGKSAIFYLKDETAIPLLVSVSNSILVESNIGVVNSLDVTTSGIPIYSYGSSTPAYLQVS